MTSDSFSTSECSARRIVVTGRVQGVGFRPFVSRMAQQLGLVGWVMNRAGVVELLVQGKNETLDTFEGSLIACAPPLARPEIAESRLAETAELAGFSILDSAQGDGRQAHIPPDYFMCDECLAEMHDPGMRRYRYPFINCTQCGPRYTIIERLPYDRPHTTMAGFPLCPECQAEYQDNRDRRYHAQPLACPRCGPSLYLTRANGSDIDDTDQALSTCIALLRQGFIVAVKGVGGYHLLCDAGSEQAVLRLRQRKNRPGKPLAVMVPMGSDSALSVARQFAWLTDVEAELLVDPLRPIVLAAKRPNPGLADAVAPGMAEIGLMLPYSPLHHLLTEAFGAPLVATSANISGEPVLTEADETERRLGSVADAFLHHNRPIRRPADDAVFRRIGGKMRPLRLGRGCAPLEWTLPVRIKKPLLAVGGQMKNTVALAWDQRLVVSPHIGDLGSRRSQDVFEQVIGDLSRLYGVDIAAVVCDAHPDYSATRWAARTGLPVTRVLHHLAHASALAGEHDITEPLLVFTWDGTGFGADGSIWGGEGFIGCPGHWQHAASFKPFRLPGGDRAAREPWRSALALLWEAGMSWPECPKPTELLHQAWRRELNSPLASSVGRLFDAAAALLGLVVDAGYEGQAPMELEAISRPGQAEITLPLIRRSDGLLLSDWAPLLPMLRDASVPIDIRGGRFHASLAAALAAQAGAIRDEHGIDRVGLVGGVFQNRLLTEQAVERLTTLGFKVYLPEHIPANDAGLCFGQIIEALALSNSPKPD